MPNGMGLSSWGENVGRSHSAAWCEDDRFSELLRRTFGDRGHTAPSCHAWRSSGHLKLDVAGSTTLISEWDGTDEEAELLINHFVDDYLRE